MCLLDMPDGIVTTYNVKSELRKINTLLILSKPKGESCLCQWPGVVLA